MHFLHYLKYLARAVWELIKDTLAQWMEHNMMLHAAGLAFYTIFSLAPLLVIIVAIAGAFFGEQAASGQLSLYMGELLGPELAESVENIVSA
ncbi:MAG: YhjD/YihY/BrkB family envelope integrity protein, partial [Cyclonatronaceae bacterium]